MSCTQCKEAIVFCRSHGCRVTGLVCKVLGVFLCWWKKKRLTSEFCTSFLVYKNHQLFVFGFWEFEKVSLTRYYESNRKRKMVVNTKWLPSRREPLFRWGTLDQLPPHACNLWQRTPAKFVFYLHYYLCLFLSHLFFRFKIEHTILILLI